MNVANEIREFLLGNTPIVDFREEYDNDDKINDFLQNIVNNCIETNSFIPTPRLSRNEITVMISYFVS